MRLVLFVVPVPVPTSGTVMRLRVRRERWGPFPCWLSIGGLVIFLIFLAPRLTRFSGRFQRKFLVTFQSVMNLTRRTSSSLIQLSVVLMVVKFRRVGIILPGVMPYWGSLPFLLKLLGRPTIQGSGRRGRHAAKLRCGRMMGQFPVVLLPILAAHKPNGVILRRRRKGFRLILIPILFSQSPRLLSCPLPIIMSTLILFLAFLRTQVLFQLLTIPVLVTFFRFILSTLFLMRLKLINFPLMVHLIKLVIQ